MTLELEILRTQIRTLEAKKYILHVLPKNMSASNLITSVSKYTAKNEVFCLGSL